MDWFHSKVVDAEFFSLKGIKIGPKKAAPRGPFLSNAR
jgi:hypothetical protein